MGTEVVAPQRRLAIGDTAYRDLVNFRGELLTLTAQNRQPMLTSLPYAVFCPVSLSFLIAVKRVPIFTRQSG